MADTFTPPAGVRSAAKRAIGWIEEGLAGGGFTAVGRRRASQLANGNAVSRETIGRMRSFFARHEVDKKAEGFNAGEKGYPSPGRVSWDSWGGNAGQTWANSIETESEKKTATATILTKSHEIKTNQRSHMAELATSYAAIVKTNKNGDGTMTVYGKATDSSIDIDQQICDETWLKDAMPQWMVSGGNIREQHSSIAAGVATEYEAKEDGHYITALVVDPVSVKKVETGVLKGFSIGIRGPRVIRDTKAAGGRIVDGQIVEISLVDRPANPNAKLMLAKAAESGELEVVKQITIPSPNAVADLVKFDPDQERDESGRFGSGGGSGSDKPESESSGSGKISSEDASHMDNKISDMSSAVYRLGDSESGFENQEAVQQLGSLVDEAYDHAMNGDYDKAFVAVDKIGELADDLRGKVDSGTVESRALTDIVNGASGFGLRYGDASGKGFEASWTDSRVSADKSSTLNSKVEPMNEINKFNEDQERDESGRFGSGGGSGGSDKPEGEGREGAGEVDHTETHNAIDDAVDEIGWVLDDLDPEADEDAANIAEQVSSFLGDANEQLSDGKVEEAKQSLDDALANANEGQDIAGMGTVIEMIQEAQDRLNESTKATRPRLTKADRSARKIQRAKNLVGSLVKFDQRKYDQACAALAGLIVVEANEMKAGHDEVRSIELLLESVKALHEWYAGEVAEGEVMGGSLEPQGEVAELYMAADPDKEKTKDKEDESKKTYKSDEEEDAEEEGEDAENADEDEDELEKKKSDKSATLDVDDEVVSSIIDKAVASAKASVVEEIDLLKSALEAERVKAIQLEGELETAKKAVAPTGPKRSVSTPAIDTNALLQKAAEYNAKAKATTDPVLSKGYRELAKDLIISTKGE